MPMEKIKIEIGKEQLVVDTHAMLQVIVREQLACHPTELCDKHVDLTFKNR